jgi:signal peptidase I
MDQETKSFNNGEEEGTAAAIGSFVWEIFKVLILALVIIIPLRVFVAEPFIVSGNSMVPNFLNNQYLIVDKVEYRFGKPERYDVIVFKYPKDTSQYFIKRIIGLPGETVKVEQGHILVINKDNPDGFVVKEPYLPNQAVTFGPDTPVTLGSREYFVLGDNRLASSDSRVWGVLPYSDIIGKAWLRAFPLNKFGIIEHQP